MTLARPSLRFDFANSPGQIDPRATFSRASIATFTDRHGVMKTAVANAPRWDYDPITGRSRGLLQEATRTNLLLHSRALDNVAWVKTNLTVTANQSAAADGTVVLETLAATGVTGTAAQAITIVAGNAITASIYARLFASNFLNITIIEGANQASAWFNLSTGAVGTNTAGTGTLAFAFKDIEDMGGGLFRCSLTVTTNTATVFTVAYSPAPSDGGATANGNSIYAGDAQGEAPGTTSHVSSYILTTVATASRAGDVFSLPLTGPWYNAAEGTLVFDFLAVRRTITGAQTLGGIGNTFDNTIYLTRGLAQLAMAIRSGAADQGTPTNAGLTFTPGLRFRTAIAWKANDFAIVHNGSVATVDTAGAIPVGPVRLMIGGVPWVAAGGGGPFDPLSQVLYFPRRLTAAHMQALTVAP